MNLNYLIKIIQILNHIILIYCLSNFYFYGNYFWISFLIFQFILIVGISSGLHRYFTHRSYETTKFWENLMLITSLPATIGTPISWIGTHRVHHAYSDQDKDPHSPKQMGFFHSYFHIWNKTKIPSSIVSDIIKNKTARFIHNYYIKILLLYIIILYLIDPIVGIIVYSIPAVFMFHATALTNAFGHTVGYRNFNTDDNSSNSKIIALFTGGEGLHNNHHANSKSPNFSTNKYEVDISWYFIKLIRK